MRVRRLISLSLLLLILAITPLSYLLSPVLGRYLIEQWFHQQGFTRVHFNLSHPGWGQLDIPGIALSYQSPGYSLTLTTGAIRLSYDPYRLLLRHQLSSVELEQAQVDLSLTEQSDKSAPLTLAQFSTLLPALWLPQLPADHISLQQLHTRVQQPDGTSWQATHQMQLTPDQAQIESQLAAAALPALSSLLTFSPDNRFIWRLDQQSQPVLTLEGQLTHPAELNTRLSLQLETALPLIRPFLPEPDILPALEGTLNTAGQLYLPDSLDFSANPLSGLKARQQFQLKSQISPPAGTLSTRLSGVLELNDSQLNLAVAKDSELNLQHWTVKGLAKPVETFTISLLKPWTMQTPLGKGLSLTKLQLKPISLHLQSSPLTLPDYRVQIAPTQLSLNQIEPVTGNLKGTLSSTRISLSRGNKTFPALTLDSVFQLKNQQFQQQFSLQIKQPDTRITGNANTDLKTFNSQLRWQANPLDLTRLASGLKPWLEPGLWPENMQLTAGELQHQGQAQLYHNAFTAELQNRVINADIAWQNNQFEGLNWRSRTTLSQDGKWNDTGEVKLTRFKKGVMLNNLDLLYRYDGGQQQDRLRVSKAQATFLQGRLSLQPFTTPLMRPAVETELNVANISLEQLLALEQQRGLSGDGWLNGTVPIKFRDGDLTIAGGQLNSAAPGGTLRFQPAQNVQAYAAANKGLAMALELLQNFHYQKLSVDLNYAADGNALLKTRLQGFNPDWSNGQPIDFNINIEENILQLIRALQLAEQLTDQIEQHYSQ